MADRVGHVPYEPRPRDRRRLGFRLPPCGDRLERGHDKKVTRTSRIPDALARGIQREAGALPDAPMYVKRQFPALTTPDSLSTHKLRHVNFGSPGVVGAAGLSSSRGGGISTRSLSVPLPPQILNALGGVFPRSRKCL